MNTTDLKQTEALLRAQQYIPDDTITMSVFLAQQMKRPLLIEGPAGVGKTEIAKVLAKAHDTRLIRLQCYEGIDATHAIYEWNYQKQLLYLKMLEKEGGKLSDTEAMIFSDDFLIKRPLLEAISQEESVVLLIDEVDRADEEFESFLLEILSDWQISIPETGTIKAKSIPQVIITSNRVRELSEALRRRCFYLWIDYPDFEKEVAIVRNKVPGIDEKLAKEICSFLMELRQLRLDKAPGVAEALDWAMALSAMHIQHLDKKTVEDTLGIVLKDWEDVRAVQLSLGELLEKVGVTQKIP